MPGRKFCINSETTVYGDPKPSTPRQIFTPAHSSPRRAHRGPRKNWRRHGDPSQRYALSFYGNWCALHPALWHRDWFGWIWICPAAKKSAGLEKIKHIGQAILADHVEIGANSCIDRAVVGATYIGQGTKLDNLCQIGHNVRIGESCVLAGQVGIAGSTTIGHGVQIGGQVGIAGHLTIGDYTRIGGKSGVTRSFGSNMEILGYPAEEASIFRRKFAASNMKPRS